MSSIKWDTEGEVPSVKVAEGPHPITGYTATATKQGKQDWVPGKETDTTVGHQQVAGKPALVGFGAGLTLNLGHFESARVEVRIEYPCPATPDGVNAAYEFCKEWVTTRLQSEAQEVRTRGTREQ